MAFRVVVVFEFDDILYPNGSAADDAVDLLTNSCEWLANELHADSVWVEDAYMSNEENKEVCDG